MIAVRRVVVRPLEPGFARPGAGFNERFQVEFQRGEILLFGEIFELLRCR
jgi:hypothetical protein